MRPRKKRRRGVFNRVAEKSVKTIDASEFKTRFEEEGKIYPDDYVPPQNIMDALMKARLDEDAANEITNKCRANTIEEKNMSGSTFDDVAFAHNLWTRY